MKNENELAQKDNFGLLNPRGELADIPLKGVKIKGVICGLHGEITVEQYYENKGAKSMEIIYTFPLPDTAAVCGFSAQIGGRKIHGKIAEKEEAFKQYDEALNQGDGAYLLEQYRPNIFQVSLGQVPPGEKVNLSISYLDNIKYQDGELRLTIPTLVAPRYIPGHETGEKTGPGWADPTDQVPDGDFITPPLSRSAAYRAELDLIIEPLLPLSDIASPSHNIKTEHLPGPQNDREKVRLSFRDGDELLNRDIVITARCRDENTMAGAVWHKSDENNGYVCLSLYPELGEYEDTEARNYIFLIDISGSMSGKKLTQARNALQLCLRNLEEGDTFNLVAFESSAHLYSRYSVLFNQENLESAGQWVDNLKSKGGTAILEPVKFALNNCTAQNTVILLFTDGQVGNEEEIINIVREKIGRNRLFTFGIDTAVNSFFINSLAEAGNGLPEFIFPGERIEDKVMRQFARITSPGVTDVTLTWEEIKEVESFPDPVKSVFNLEPLIIAARCTGRPAGRVILRGKVKKAEFKTGVDLSVLEEHRESAILQRVWAKMKIENMTAMLSSINPRRKNSLIKEIVKLSAECGVISPHTSFVAVEERENKETGIPETVIVPVTPAADWDMLQPVETLNYMPPPVPGAVSEKPAFRGGRRKKMTMPFLKSSSPPPQKGGYGQSRELRKSAYLHEGDYMAEPCDTVLSCLAHSGAAGSEEAMPVAGAGPGTGTGTGAGMGAGIGTGAGVLSGEELRREAVRLLAMQQMADGSFGAPAAADGGRSDKTVLSTALAVLALITGSDNLAIYHRQAEKAVNYILNYLDSRDVAGGLPMNNISALLEQDHPSERQNAILLAGVALHIYLEKGSPKKKTARKVKDILAKEGFDSLSSHIDDYCQKLFSTGELKDRPEAVDRTETADMPAKALLIVFRNEKADSLAELVKEGRPDAGSLARAIMPE